MHFDSSEILFKYFLKVLLVTIFYTSKAVFLIELPRPDSVSTFYSLCRRSLDIAKGSLTMLSHGC